MSRQIIRQPNGLYCVWSTVVDNFVIYNASVDDLIDMAIEDAKREIEGDIRRIVAELEIGGKPYYQFTKSFDEAVDSARTLRPQEPGALDTANEVDREARIPVDNVIDTEK